MLYAISRQNFGGLHHRFDLVLQEVHKSVFAAHVPVRADVQYLYD